MELTMTERHFESATLDAVEKDNEKSSNSKSQNKNNNKEKKKKNKQRGFDYWQWRLLSNKLSFGPAEMLTVSEALCHAKLYLHRSIRVTGLLQSRSDN